MSENYKHYEIKGDANIRTMGDLKQFTYDNISIPEEDFLVIVVKYLIVPVDMGYITKIIKKYRRQYKIKKLFKNE